MDYRELAELLIHRYQTGFPLTSRPFKVIADELGLAEEQIMETFQRLLEEGLISRLGPVFTTHRVGYSFLAAMACPQEKIDSIAEFVNSFDEVNHNYEREGKLNLWFVLTGKDESHLDSVVKKIEQETGLVVHPFPMLRPFKIDLSLKGKIDWSRV